MDVKFGDRGELLKYFHIPAKGSSGPSHTYCTELKKMIGIVDGSKLHLHCTGLSWR